MEQIETGVFIETGYQGVTLGALALSHGTILIDAPPCPEDARSWRAALRNLGSGVNRMLINLDSHYDRTLGVRSLDCAVMAHRHTAKNLAERSAVFKGQPLESGGFWENCIGLSGIRWAIPDLTFDQRSTLHWDQKPVILEHHPGPSPDAIWVLIPSARVAFVGDVVLLNQPPFLAEADLPTWIEALDLLISVPFRDYMVVSGRGGLVPLEVLRAQRRTMKYILKRMETLAGREAGPEATESMIPKLLSDLDFPSELETQFTARLRYGLQRYYLHHYQPAEVVDEP